MSHTPNVVGYHHGLTFTVVAASAAYSIAITIEDASAIAWAIATFGCSDFVATLGDFDCFAAWASYSKGRDCSSCY